MMMLTPLFIRYFYYLILFLCYFFCILRLLKSHKQLRTQCQYVVSLCALVKEDECELLCHKCGLLYWDPIVHIIASCPSVITILEMNCGMKLLILDRLSLVLRYIRWMILMFVSSICRNLILTFSVLYVFHSFTKCANIFNIYPNYSKLTVLNS